MLVKGKRAAITLAFRNKDGDDGDNGEPLGTSVEQEGVGGAPE